MFGVFNPTRKQLERVCEFRYNPELKGGLVSILLDDGRPLKNVAGVEEHLVGPDKLVVEMMVAIHVAWSGHEFELKRIHHDDPRWNVWVWERKD